MPHSSLDLCSLLNMLNPAPGLISPQVYKQMLNRAKCVYTSQEALAWMIDVAHGMQVDDVSAYKFVCGPSVAHPNI